MNIPKQPGFTCYDEAAKKAQSAKIRKVYREAAKLLPEFRIEVHFNRGGIAVWGETYAKIYAGSAPVVEAYDTSMGLLVRQWDGRNSGMNNYVTTLDGFVTLVKDLARKPFVRF